MLLTRAGKSLLFMLLAVMQNTSISIVVMLFVALADDLVEQARLANINYIRF